MFRPTFRQRLAGWLAPETRALYGGPTSVSPGGTGIITLSGAGINERTALSIMGVWAAVNCYVNTLSALPFYIAERDDKGGRRPAPEHPAFELLKLRPNMRSTSMRLRQAWIGHALTWGNGYLEIEWKGRYPSALNLMDPRKVTPVEIDDRIVYNQSNGPDLPAEDVIHLAMFGWDGVKGYSPIEVGRETLGTSAARRDYEAGLYNNSAAAQGHLEVQGNLNTIEKNQLRTYWNKMHQGPGKAGNVGILEGGMRWVQTNFSPQDAQMILGARFAIEDIARLYNLPQHKLNGLDHATFSNVEELNSDFYQTSVLPWIIAIEQECDLKLLSKAERKDFFCYHEVGGLLRGNIAAQTAQETADLSSGVRSLNEIRIARGLNPIRDVFADYHWIPVNNLQALETMGQVSETPTDPAIADPAAIPENAPVVSEPIDDVQAAALNGAQIASLLAIVQQVVMGTLPAEAAKGLIAASFPTLGTLQIETILGSLAGFTPKIEGSGPPPASTPDASSLRAVLEDSIGRMIRREGQALRRHAKREDFAGWLETFYPGHRETFAAAIRPALRSIEALTGRAIDADQVAIEVETESRRQLRDLVVCFPPDEMLGQVERLCTAWETHRSKALASSLCER